MTDDVIEQQLVETTESDIVAPGYTLGAVSDEIAGVVLTKRTPVFWVGTFFAGFTLLMLFLLSAALLMTKGVECPWHGASRLPISSGGSALATPAR